MKTSLCISLYLLMILALPATMSATAAEVLQQNDSIANLNEVVITAHVADDIIPAQKLDGEALQRLNSNSVADAMRYFSGVQVKDYGGIGGIKTVNVRSMGSQHTGVAYDGIQLGNAQNGQIDLGQLSLDNVEAISLYNGQKSDLLQPARDFGNAGSVYLHSRRPAFLNNEKYHLRASMKCGSFDLANPSVRIDYRLSNAVNLSLGGEYLYSSGRYKFRYRRVLPNGDLAYDTVATRQNGDVNALRVEADSYGTFSTGNWHAKIYHYNSERGVPGAIVNNVWRRGERIWDNNTFIQGSCQLSNRKFSSLNNIKYAYYITRYLNDDERQLRVDNHYHQQECYLSSSNEYRICSPWRISLSYDFSFNTMTADTYRFVKPYRVSNLLALASALNFNRIKAQGSILATFINDFFEQHPEKKQHFQRFTPAVYLNAYPLNSQDFSLRAFYKQSYRMPTFNDLYYTDMGNAELKPERAEQYNVGLLYEKSNSGFWSALRFSFDGYLNYVHDKIVAYPKGTQFRWTMLNLGVVKIKGVDASAMATINPVKQLFATLRLQYTFQRAIDITDPTDSYYRHQIPYIPRNSGSVTASATWKTWDINYSFIYVGERYNQQENILYNYTQPWYTHDLSLSYQFKLHAVEYKLAAEINNLLNQSYDVIINYPMPGRNFKFTISINL